jgi:hypothetical protein
VRYCRALAKLLNWEASYTGGPQSPDNLDCRSIGVVHKLLPINYVLEIGALVQEQAPWPSLHNDAQEMVKQAKVLHSELPLKSWDGFLKNTVGSYEDNVINI